MRILEELALDGKKTLGIGGADLCELLGISPAALTDLKNRGLAVKLGHDSYDMGATVAAYTAHLRQIAAGRGGEDHVLALTTERARLAREQADAQAMKNAERRGELVTAASVLSGWSDTLRGLRARMLTLTARLRADLPHLSASDVALIDREMRNTLEGLANGDD